MYLLFESCPRKGLLDVDIYGPSLPILVHPDHPEVHQSSLGPGMVKPITHQGVKLMSLGYVSPNVRSLHSNYHVPCLVWNAHTNISAFVCCCRPLSSFFIYISCLNKKERSSRKWSWWWCCSHERTHGRKSRHSAVSYSYMCNISFLHKQK
jgi:hypothetical protein